MIAPAAIWLAGGALALACAALERGAGRRAAAAALPLCLAMLAVPPRWPDRAAATGSLPGGADRATVEAAARGVARGGTITVGGDGLHPDLWPLLAGRRTAWAPPPPSPGLAGLAWPRRAWLGEPVLVHGHLTAGDTTVVTLEGPAGERDTVRTDGAFRFQLAPRAAGPTEWILRVGAAAPDTLALDVREPPRLQVTILAARPDFALPALARRLEAQGAGVTLRTTLTATDARTVRYGPAADGDPLAAEALAALDLLVLGDGAESALADAVRGRIEAAVRDGLGVVHLVAAPRGGTALFPFTTTPVADAPRDGEVRLDGASLPGRVPLAPLRLAGGVVLATDGGGDAVARAVSLGRGRLVASRVTAPFRWSLAGAPEAEAAWWARIAGAAVRPSAGHWVVSDSAPVRVDEPVRVRWIGDTTGVTVIREEDRVDTVAWARADSIGGEVILWPRDTGWLTVERASDTLRLRIHGPAAHDVLASAERRRAAGAAVAAQVGEGPEADPRPREAPRWPFALALLGAAAVAWRRR